MAAQASPAAASKEYTIKLRDLTPSSTKHITLSISDSETMYSVLGKVCKAWGANQEQLMLSRPLKDGNTIFWSCQNPLSGRAAVSFAGSPPEQFLKILSYNPGTPFATLITADLIKSIKLSDLDSTLVTELGVWTSVYFS